MESRVYTEYFIFQINASLIVPASVIRENRATFFSFDQQDTSKTFAVSKYSGSTDQN
jgi:hypothetical protein